MDGAVDEMASTRPEANGQTMGNAPTAKPDNHRESQALDPTQLVHMALSLSEGRKRYSSAPIGAATVSAEGRRISSLDTPAMSVLPGSIRTNDHYYSHARQSQSGTYSHLGTSRSPKINQLGNFSPRLDEEVRGSDVGEPVEPPFQVSGGTMARADKARTFFELSCEYRRLLQCLPPLKPDLTAPGNFSVATHSTSGSAHPEFTRIRSNTLSKHDLGRAYNPLQLLRNNKTRQRQRRPLQPAPAAFQDLQQVRQYVDNLEEYSSSTVYRAVPDTVDLPPFLNDQSEIKDESIIRRAGHKRSDTAASRIQWTESSWSFDPMELFADTLWSEDSGNKGLLENRRGDPLFPDLVTRMSFESSRPGRKSVETNRKSLSRRSSNDSTTGPVQDDKRTRKRRKFLSISRVEDEARRRLTGRKNKSVDSLSSSSESEDERRARHVLHGDDHPENIGPLERHMRRVMQEEHIDNISDVDSPDKWDNPSPEKARRRSVASPHFGPQVHSSPRRPLPLDLRRRERRDNDNESIDSIVDPNSRSATDPESTVPNTPMAPSFIAPIGMDLSSPTNDKSSRKWRSHLGLSRTDTKAKQSIQVTDFATMVSDMPKESDVSKAATRENGAKHGFRFPAPSLLGRDKDKGRLSAEFDREMEDPDVYDSKRGSKGKAHFLKDRRLGALLRGDSSRRASRSSLEENSDHRKSISSGSDSDTQADGEAVDQGDYRRHDRTTHERPIDHDVGGPESMVPGSRVALPSFRRVSEVEVDKATESLTTDPIARQESARRVQSENSRHKLMTLPKLEVPNNDASESSSAGDTPSPGNTGFGRNRPGHRKMERNESHLQLGAPGSFPRATKLPVTGLTRLLTETANGLSDERGWNISSTTVNQTSTTVSRRDIARIRALFLSSGIKAFELCGKSDRTRDPKPDFLLKTSGHESGPTITREEHQTAAQLLSTSIEESLQQSSKDVDTFASQTAADLRDSIEKLKQKAAEDLTRTMHDTADEADQFVGELSTQQTLAVKQVNDAIDGLYRNRRRRLRWVRRIGFTVLEWLVLGLMWFVWFVVVVLRLTKGSVMGLVNGVKWLIWA